MNGVSCICHYTGHHPTQWSVVRLLNSNYNSDMTKVVSIVITKQHPSLSSTLSTSINRLVYQVVNTPSSSSSVPPR